MGGNGAADFFCPRSVKLSEGVKGVQESHNVGLSIWREVESLGSRVGHYDSRGSPAKRGKGTAIVMKENYRLDFRCAARCDHSKSRRRFEINCVGEQRGESKKKRLGRCHIAAKK